MYMIFGFANKDMFFGMLVNGEVKKVWSPREKANAVTFVEETLQKYGVDGKVINARMEIIDDVERMSIQPLETISGIIVEQIYMHNDGYFILVKPGQEDILILAEMAFGDSDEPFQCEVCGTCY